MRSYFAARAALVLLAGAAWAQQADSGGPAAIFDKIYSTSAPLFNPDASAFLARAVENVAVGKALDVAMGQGRNSLFLARKGWQVTGYDVSSVGLSVAQASAAKAGLKIETVQKSHADFDFGTDRWDLVVMVFPGTSMDDLELLRKIKASMKKGAMIVVEQFNAPPGEGSKGPANALFGSFQEFRVVRYEDVVDTSDWGKMKARIGRLAAIKE
jgi:2-polyprenyl-3-methyl-5-hydroxy-6-metoxy-1,4-benzoquinol methylase